MGRTHPVLLMLAQSALFWVGAPKTIRQPFCPSHYYKGSYFFKKLSFLTAGSIRLRKYNSQDQEIGVTRPLPIIAQRLGLGLGLVSSWREETLSQAYPEICRGLQGYGFWELPPMLVWIF